MAATLGKLNPFRYRGYVYDEETGMYYLRSRYYAVHLCRFINADSHIERNLYRYCDNTPVSTSDATGHSASDARFSVCAVAEGGGYLSPSARQPNAVFSIDARGRNKWPIPVSYFLAYLDQMYRSGQFVYPDTENISASGYIVDCIGLIRTAFRPYSESLFRNGPQAVYGMEKASRKYGYETQEVQGNEDNLIPGMAIYWYNTKGKSIQGKWPHIGVYLGEYLDPTNGTYYTDAVIQSASGSYMRVVVRSLADIQSGLDHTPAFDGYILKYGKIKYVDYSN